MAKIRIIYITSLGHSGSTLLDVLLNQHQKLQSVGEIMFFDEWMSNDLLCSCGTMIKKCPFWAKAISENIPALGDMDAHGYNDNSFLLFKAISNINHSTAIVDSSKSPQRLMRLLSDPRFDVKVIHLVRNGLAVTNSLRKSHARPGTSNEQMTIATPAYKGMLRWLRRNKSIERISKTMGDEKMLRVRYEDLCLQPEQVLQNICSFVGIDFDPAILIPTLTNNHNIGGSRWRFSDKVVKIKLDEKWRDELGLGAKLLFQIIGKRLNKNYGY